MRSGTNASLSTSGRAVSSCSRLAVCIAVIWRALRAEARVLQEQDHFLALVSHQFKTPLASLQLSLETLTMRQLSPAEQRPLIDRMLSDLSRMETLVTRILDSVRLERGRVDFKRQPIDLRAAVSPRRRPARERARVQQRITISADVPRGLEVFADPMAVDVVIRNLLENALAAVAPVGGGTITLSATAYGWRDRAFDSRHRRGLPSRRQRASCSRSSRACTRAAAPRIRARASGSSSFAA